MDVIHETYVGIPASEDIDEIPDTSRLVKIRYSFIVFYHTPVAPEIIPHLPDGDYFELRACLYIYDIFDFIEDSDLDPDL